MKRILKGSEPPTLTHFRNAELLGKWEEMKNDPHFGGQQAYQDCRDYLLNQQKGLCAYCEIGIHDNNPLKSRIEHFHPKADISSQHNWALDWQNMLAVCNGGSYEHIKVAGYYLEPMAQNLSCDAHKDKMIQTNKLPEKCEGWILNPFQLAAFPALFRIEKSSGKLLPDSDACVIHPSFSDNQHQSVQELVQYTIDMLNLNCDRLCQARLLLIRNIEKNKKRQRQEGFNAHQGLANLARRYFGNQWTEFFTTMRLCLGQPAEHYLHSINFQG